MKFTSFNSLRRWRSESKFMLARAMHNKPLCVSRLIISSMALARLDLTTMGTTCNVLQDLFRFPSTGLSGKDCSIYVVNIQNKDGVHARPLAVSSLAQNACTSTRNPLRGQCTHHTHTPSDSPTDCGEWLSGDSQLACNGTDAGGAVKSSTPHACSQSSAVRERLSRRAWWLGSKTLSCRKVRKSEWRKRSGASMLL